jgi:uncharacterized protein
MLRVASFCVAILLTGLSPSVFASPSPVGGPILPESPKPTSAPSPLETLIHRALEADAACATEIDGMHAYATNTVRAVPEAVRCLTRGADLEPNEPCREPGLLLLRGNGGQKDPERAAPLLRHAADAGDAEAEAALGVMYPCGDGLPQDWSHAIEWSRRAVGFPAAWFALDRAYEEASGTMKDDGEALTWYQLAADDDVTIKQYCLGDIAEFAEPGQPRSDQGALRWYCLAVDHEAIAEERIGDLYWQGSAGLPRDRVEAVRHYVIAANRGIASAERKLAIAYANGDGAQADDAEMLRWDRKAAEAGDAVAAGLLGYAIMLGLDGSYDLVEAATWLTLAAEHASPGEWRVRAAAYSQEAQSKLTSSEREAFRARLARMRTAREGE